MTLEFYLYNIYISFFCPTSFPSLPFIYHILFLLLTSITTDPLEVLTETLQSTQPKHLPYFLVVTSAIRTYTAEQYGNYVFWDVLQDDLHLWEQHIEFTKLMVMFTVVSC